MLIFGMKAHLIDTHVLVLRSRSSAKVKVKYQGHVSQKMGILGGISVSQTNFALFPVHFGLKVCSAIFRCLHNIPKKT